MKGKNLILKEEVIRILEMMKIDSEKSHILNESIIDDIISASVKFGVKSTDDITTKITKLETKFGLPKGTLKPNDITKLAKGGAEAQSVVVKIIANLKGSNLTNFAKKVWNQLQSDKIHDNAKTVFDNLVKNGKKQTSTETLGYLNDQAKIFIKDDSEINNLVIELRKIFVNNAYTKVKSSGLIDDVAGSAGKSTKSTSEPTFKPVGKTGMELYNEVLTKLERSETFNKLPSDVRSKYLKRLKSEAEGNPTLGIKELSEKYDGLAQKYFTPTKWKKYKAWKAGLPDWQRYSLNALLTLLAAGALGGIQQLSPAIWELLKESGDVFVGGFDEFDWNEVVDAWESGETTEEDGEVTIGDFREFIKNDWGVEYTGNETFKEDNNLFIVNDGSKDFKYEYKNDTFKYIEQ
jgi:hypothetical protein